MPEASYKTSKVISIIILTVTLVSTNLKIATIMGGSRMMRRGWWFLITSTCSRLNIYKDLGH